MLYKIEVFFVIMILCEIVQELDWYIVGQYDVKCVVVIVLCNCWCCMQLLVELCNEVMFKNILMIGLIGVGKIEIVCCLVMLVNVLFVKVEVICFIEVGYVGKDVEQIICDFVDMVVKLYCEQVKVCVCNQVEECVEDCIFDVLLLCCSIGIGFDVEVVCNELFVQDNEMWIKFCCMLCNGELDECEIELEVLVNVGVDIMILLGMEEMGQQLCQMFFSMGGVKVQKCMLSIKVVCLLLIEEEVGKLVNEDDICSVVIEVCEQYGIVFIDEIDKVVKCGEVGVFGGDVLCEGVQCDLLLLVEGFNVFIKYGMVKIDYILFIVFGVFYLVKFSDLIFELQGCFLIWVELGVFSKNDFVCIFIELKVVLIKQYEVLLFIEGVLVVFIVDVVDCLVEIVFQVNEWQENIGVCCFYMVFE